MRKINRVESFRYAFEGIWYTLKTQRNAQIHLVITVLVLITALGLRVSRTELALLALTAGFVWASELLNTAAETAMDYATLEFHPQVKIVKDVAAGAVLIAALTAVIVGLLVLGPPLWALLAGGIRPN